MKRSTNLRAFFFCLLIFFTILSVGIKTTVAAGDDKEPNDDPSTAYPLTDGTYYNLMLNTTDEDYFSLSMKTGGSITVMATFTDAEGNIDMELYSPYGVRVDYSNYTGIGIEVVYHSDTTNGNYTIRMYRNGAGLDYQVYTLDVSIYNPYNLPDDFNFHPPNLNAGIPPELILIIVIIGIALLAIFGIHKASQYKILHPSFKAEKKAFRAPKTEGKKERKKKEKAIEFEFDDDNL